MDMIGELLRGFLLGAGAGVGLFVIVIIMMIWEWIHDQHDKWKKGDSSVTKTEPKKIEIPYVDEKVEPANVMPANIVGVD